MTTVFAIVLVVHGLIHLLGFGQSPQNCREEARRNLAAAEHLAAREVDGHRRIATLLKGRTAKRSSGSANQILPRFHFAPSTTSGMMSIGRTGSTSFSP